MYVCLFVCRGKLVHQSGLGTSEIIWTPKKFEQTSRIFKYRGNHDNNQDNIKSSNGAKQTRSRGPPEQVADKLGRSTHLGRLIEPDIFEVADE